jgi:hypothetical protein
MESGDCAVAGARNGERGERVRERSAGRRLLASFRERPHSDNPGGLNGSLQHLLKVFFLESTRLISFMGIDSNKTKPCLGSD